MTIGASCSFSNAQACSLPRRATRPGRCGSPESLKPCATEPELRCRQPIALALSPGSWRRSGALPAAEAKAATSSGRALAPGQALSPQQLRTLLSNGASPWAAVRQRGALSWREREIAAYVARGWTNQQMADALIVSRRTVESHVSHIFGKLGLTTRAQVAVWASQHGLTESQPPI